MAVDTPKRRWPVQDAKARFSELLERRLREGPQIVTRRGEETAVLVPLEDWQRPAAWYPRQRMKPPPSASSGSAVTPTPVHGVSHSRDDESLEAKARWFRSLSVEERMAYLTEITELALQSNPRISEAKDAPAASGRVRVLALP